MKPLARKHLDEVQYARVLALFGVFAVHSSSTGVVGTNPESFTFIIYNFFNIAGKIGTPVFIFLSSFVLFYTYYHRELTASLFQKFYKKRLLYILVPYVVFSAFYFLFKAYLNKNFTDIPVMLEEFLRDLATGKAHNHLYFVFVSVQFYLMFPILLYLFKKFAFIRRYAIPIGFIIQWAWVLLNSAYLQVPAKGSVALTYFMFYFFGAFLGVYYEKVAAWIGNWRKVWPAIALIVAGYFYMIYFYVSVYYDIRTGQWSGNSKWIEFGWSMHALFAAAVIFIFVHFLETWNLPRIKKFMLEIGAVSFGMYLIHPFFLMILRMYVSGGEPLIFHSWQLITLLVTFFSSWLIVRLFYDFVPNSWIFFGQGNRVFNKSKKAKKTTEANI
ncbi:acyltransferase [Planococcus antarcticus DSM 14505]|uniref:Acyltransferase n=1 Tax=Planococcus antarcticus DSM 14505 TaxID=1185653 RepID=A0ABN4RDM4_9BACL|nr:acyltransferase [Planococcus antarcticus]ANU10092.1 acyltransferase [Planococcus antarcticus DSM 14505]